MRAPNISVSDMPDVLRRFEQIPADQLRQMSHMLSEHAVPPWGGSITEQFPAHTAGTCTMPVVMASTWMAAQTVLPPAPTRLVSENDRIRRPEYEEALFLAVMLNRPEEPGAN